MKKNIYEKKTTLTDSVSLLGIKTIYLKDSWGFVLVVL